MGIEPENKILILDFDHTLFLSNSTEEYLSTAHPRALSSIMLALFDWMKLWNIFPGKDKRIIYRDSIRVILASVFFPWMYFLYKKRISSLLKAYLNSEILDIAASQQWEKIIVASNGFAFIIKPLLAQINIQVDDILCSRMLPTNTGIRAVGKKAYLEDVLTANELSHSVFISDNTEDRALQGVVNQFVFYENQQAKRFKTEQNVYLPFVYTHASKRGNSNHLLNVVICSDYSICLLAYVRLASVSLQLIISILFLLLSLWCIYEACYFENDLHELRYEAKHKNVGLIEYVKKNQDFPLERSAWFWAISLGFFSLFLLRNDSTSIGTLFSSDLLLDFLFWMIWLIALRLFFRAYTHSPFSQRVGGYPVLQLFRLAGPALFLAIDSLGAFLIVAQVINEWFGYLMYRTGGDRSVATNGLVRHVVFVMLVSALAVVQKDLGVFVSAQFLLILFWSLVRGNLKRFMSLAHLGRQTSKNC